MAIEARGDRPHRLTDVGDQDLGHAEPEGPLAHQRRGAARDCIGREVVAVGPKAADAEEQRSRGDVGCRVGKSRDLHVRGPAAGELAERHLG